MDELTGISLMDSDNNILTGNTANSHGNSGIYLGSANDNTITSNKVSLSDCGIKLEQATGNTVNSNNVSLNECGIAMAFFANNNLITNNTAITNSLGT